jgi:hypothetical protein
MYPPGLYPVTVVPKLAVMVPLMFAVGVTAAGLSKRYPLVVPPIVLTVVPVWTIFAGLCEIVEVGLTIRKTFPAVPADEVLMLDAVTAVPAAPEETKTEPP